MISILMPVKNEAMYIKALIESLHLQTFSNFELIAIDDHSIDDTFKILSDFSVLDKRIRVFKNNGDGIIAALQTAYTNASGDYITRQDADDIMPAKKLEILRNTLDHSGPGSVATGKVHYFSDGELKQGFINYANWLNSLCENDTHYQAIFKECVLASANWMMKRVDFDLVGAFNHAIYPEDYHFVFRLYENNIKIKSSDIITHLWRDHPLRASRTLPQYQDQKFYALKVNYFKRIHGEQEVCLWGAGPSGKKLAKELKQQNVSFKWVTDNKKKIGKIIYDSKIDSPEYLRCNNKLTVLIAVTQKNSLKEITTYLQQIKISKFHEF